MHRSFLILSTAALMAASAGRRRPVHFLVVLTIGGGALTASEVAAVVAAWLTLHNNHFLTIIIDSEAFTDNSFYNKEAISAITMKFSAISPYFHHSSQHSCLCCITYVMHIILSRMRPGPGDLLICY